MSSYVQHDALQVLKERIAWLEETNEDLCRELHEYRSRCGFVERCEIDETVREQENLQILACYFYFC